MPESDRQPATRQDLAASEARLTSEIGNLDARLTSEIGNLRAEMKEEFLAFAQRLERAETTLLDGFRNYAKTQALRTQSIEGRLNEVERRLLDLEEQLGRQRQ